MSNTALDKQTSITASFVGYAEGLGQRAKLNLDLIRGEKPLATTDNGLLVRGVGMGIERLGERILGSWKHEGQALQTEIVGGATIFLGHGQTFRKNLSARKLTDEGHRNIERAIPEEGMRETIRGLIEGNSNAYDGGEPGTFEVYRLDNPEEHEGPIFRPPVFKEVDGVMTFVPEETDPDKKPPTHGAAAYAIYSSSVTKTPNGRMAGMTVQGYTADGEQVDAVREFGHHLASKASASFIYPALRGI